MGDDQTTGGPAGAVGSDDETITLLDAVRPRLARAFVAAYGADRGEEALSEALTWAWEHRDRLAGLDNPAGYLYRVGQSRSRPRWREARVVFPPPAEVGVPHIEPALAGALAELTERQRVCVGLVSGHGWTHQETADLLGLSRSSVQNHVERGMRRLRTELGAVPDA